MTRKDSEKDAERPHYYSQFWLDIAAGRRVIGGPKPEEAEASEAEAPEPAPVRKAGRGSEPVKETPRASVVAEPEVEEEELEQDTAVEEGEIPTIVFDEDAEVIDEEEAEEEYSDEEDFFEDEDEDEDEDEEWGRRGARKKARPARPTKAPKKPKRDTRRGF